MKKIFVITSLCILAQMSLVAKAAVAPTGQKKKNNGETLTMKASDCRRLEGTPTIIVCVEGDPGGGIFDENALRALKGVTKNLVARYKEKQLNAGLVRKTSVTNSCGPMPDLSVDPVSYLAWMNCGATETLTTPIVDPCANPSDPMCPNHIQTPDPCADPSNPMCPNHIQTPNPCADPSDPMCPNHIQTPNPCADPSDPMCQ